VRGTRNKAFAADGAKVSGEADEPIEKALIAHLPGLRRYATALTGSASAADDLVQDCIERALRRWATLQDRQRLAAWLRSILHNLYLDEKRRGRSRGIGVDLTEMDNDLALSALPEDRTVATDLMRAMSRLSAEHRQILLLVGLEGLSYREIADELAIEIGTVMSRLARARDRLRQIMEEGENRRVLPFPQRRVER
jgi:RNA polymerase sigma-70 factor, ECF subfamily